MSVAVAAALGAGVGAGIAMLLFALFGTGPSSFRTPRRVRSLEGGRRRLLACAGIGLAVGVLTRWPVAALLAMLCAWWWPTLFGAKGAVQQAIARINAIAAWTEMLRGMMAAAASIEQAIVATVPLAPEPIRPDLEALARRIRQGQPLAIALRPLADAIDDDTARAKATMRLRVQADRARLHAAARAITLGVIAILLLVGRSFLAPYGTPGGQLALLGVGAVFAVGLGGLTWLGRHGAAERFITARTPHPEGAPRA